MGETFELSITNQSSENVEYIQIQYDGFLGYAQKYYTDTDLDVGQTDTIDVPIDYHFIWIYGDTLKWDFWSIDDGNEVVLYNENASIYATRFEITNQSSETIGEVFAFSCYDYSAYSHSTPENLIEQVLQSGTSESIKTEIRDKYFFAKSADCIWTSHIDNLTVENAEWVLSDINSIKRRYITVTNQSSEGINFMWYRGNSPSTEWFPVFASGSSIYDDVLNTGESFMFERLAVPLLGFQAFSTDRIWIFETDEIPDDSHLVLNDSNSQAR